MASKNILLKNGKTITILLNNEWDCVEFYDNGNKLDGEFEFKDESLNNNLTDFLLKRMYTPKLYKNQGAGTEVLKFFRAETGCNSIYARHNDGIERDDGSHLTDDAPIFVEAMIKKSLIDYQK